MLLSLLLPTALAFQTVRLEVATPRGFDGQVLARTTWLGEERSTTLSDDGSGPGDVAGDGLYVAEWEGEFVRTLPVELVVTDDRGAVLAYAGLERVMNPYDRLAWAVEIDETVTARRVAAPFLVRPLEAREMSWVGASIGWAGLVFLYVAWLVGRREDQES